MPVPGPPSSYAHWFHGLYRIIYRQGRIIAEARGSLTKDRSADHALPRGRPRIHRAGRLLFGERHEEWAQPPAEAAGDAERTLVAQGEGGAESLTS